MIQLQFDLPLIAEKDIKNFIEKELKIEEDDSNILVKGLEHNQRDIKRFINILNLMKNIGDSIEEFEYDEELLLKWSILNFSSEDFINHVKINNKIIIDMQKISMMRTEKEIEDYIETLDASFREIYLRFKDEKYLEILKSGNKEFKEKDIRNYVFLCSLSSKEPIEYFADNKELADSFILKTTSFFREKDQQRLQGEDLKGKKFYDIRAIIDSSIPLALKNVAHVKYYLDPTYRG